jgi:hypothetical protein
MIRSGGSWFIVREEIFILHRVFSFQERGVQRYAQLITAERSLTAIMR